MNRKCCTATEITPLPNHNNRAVRCYWSSCLDQQPTWKSQSHTIQMTHIFQTVLTFSDFFRFSVHLWRRLSRTRRNSSFISQQDIHIQQSIQHTNPLKYCQVTRFFSSQKRLPGRKHSPFCSSWSKSSSAACLSFAPAPAGRDEGSHSPRDPPPAGRFLLPPPLPHLPFSAALSLFSPSSAPSSLVSSQVPSSSARRRWKPIRI